MAGVIKFKIRSGGTGAVISTVSLSLDESVPIPSDYKQEADPQLTKYSVRVHYFPAVALTTEALAKEARRLVVARLDELKVQLGWRGTPVVRPLGRGKVAMPHIYENFGDLVMSSATGDSLLLDDCTLYDATIDDDNEMVEGIALRLIFCRPCDAMAV